LRWGGVRAYTPTAPRHLPCSPEEGDHQGVLELGVGAGVEAVHAAEALARGTAAQHLHVPFLRQLLAQRVGLLTRHDQLQQDVAILREDRSAGIVQSESLGGRFPHLDGPERLRHSWGDKAQELEPVRRSRAPARTP